MSFLDNFHFIRPAWLSLLPIVCLIWWVTCRAQDRLRGWRVLMDHELLAALVVAQPAGLPWQAVSALTASLMAVFAIAGPTWRPEPSPFADDPVPVMIVLRAGETMDEADLMPSRMERARLKIADFAVQRKGQPLGLVAYSGSAHLVLPPTRDTTVVATMAAEITTMIMPKSGDDLLGALALARRTLGEEGGSIVVVADTINEKSERPFAQFRAASRLPIYILAGARPGTPELNALQRAASSLGAEIVLMTADSADVLSLVRRTANTPVATRGAGESTRWAEAGWWIVPVIALLSLFGFQRVRSTALMETTT